MERGVLDAFEFNNPTSDQTGSSGCMQKVCIRFFSSGYGIFEILFNRTKFNALSDDLKAILEYAAEAASSSNTWTAQKNYSKDLQALIVKIRLEVSRTSREVFAAQLEAWDKVTAG